jgi:DNA-binding CsgD family transcriptional regulator
MVSVSTDPMHVRDRDARGVAALIGEIGEFPAADYEEALAHMLGGLGRLIGCTNTFWLAGRKDSLRSAEDPMAGWRPHAIRYHLYSEERQKLAAQLSERLLPGSRSAYSGDARAHGRDAVSAAPRARRRRGLVELVAGERISPAAESLGSIAERLQPGSFHRILRRDRPRPRRQAVRRAGTRPLRLFQLGSSRFHKDTLRTFGLLRTSNPLSPRERQILRLLLTDMTEGEIAAALSLSKGTVHQYTVSVLRKLGVKRRTGLLALWLRTDRRP